MRTSNPINVTPEPQDRKEAVPDGLLREMVKASMADGRPSVPAGDVFKRLRAHHGRRAKAADCGA
jgi:antitoxin ParD1/3/4